MTQDNPKHIQAQKEGKIPMELVPWASMAAVARVLAGGAGKYGRRNWQIDSIKASTYIGAIARHALLEWAEGVDKDKDDGEHPLAHVAACCVLVMDAERTGKLIDDRLYAESKDPATREVTKQGAVPCWGGIKEVLVQPGKFYAVEDLDKILQVRSGELTEVRTPSGDTFYTWQDHGR